jgi:outer membrane biosynthesis protein TonB
MTRFEKKCLVGAAGLHGLLLVTVVATAAFQGEPPKQTIVPITWVALQTTDKPGLMAGNPDARPTVVKTQTPVKPAEPAIQPQPEKPQPEKVQPDPAPPKVQADPPPKPQVKHNVERDSTPIHKADSEPKNPKSWKPRLANDIKVDVSSATKVKTTHRPTKSSTSDEEADARAQAAAQRKAAHDISQALSGLASSIPKGTAKAAVFDLPGQGGSTTFANYRNVIFSAYYNAWNCPQDVENDLASVEVKVVVARDGSIVSAEITKKSSDSTLNKSVQRALDAVTKLQPFPEGARDEQRSFKIRFNVKDKQSIG